MQSRVIPIGASPEGKAEAKEATRRTQHQTTTQPTQATETTRQQNNRTTRTASNTTQQQQDEKNTGRTGKQQRTNDDDEKRKTARQQPTTPKQESSVSDHMTIALSVLTLPRHGWQQATLTSLRTAACRPVKTSVKQLWKPSLNASSGSQSLESVHCLSNQTR